MTAAAEAYNASGAVPQPREQRRRDRRLPDGLGLVDPDIVQVPEWWPDTQGPGDAAVAVVDAYRGVGAQG
jgi:hypothetical protein